MLDEQLHHLPQHQDLRPPVDQREHDHAEGGLHLRMLVQIVEHHLGIGVAPQFHHDAEPVAIRLVADVGDVFELLLVDQVGDLFDQAGFVDLIRDFGDDDALAVVLSGFDAGPRAHDDTSAPLV